MLNNPQELVAMGQEILPIIHTTLCGLDTINLSVPGSMNLGVLGSTNPGVLHSTNLPGRPDWASWTRRTWAPRARRA